MRAVLLQLALLFSAAIAAPQNGLQREVSLDSKFQIIEGPNFDDVRIKGGSKID